MKIVSIAISILTLASTGSASEVIASAEQTREWTEKDPPKGLTITNKDRYVDYQRDDKTVFRRVNRTVKLSIGAEAVQHSLEFVVNGNVFASVGLSYPGFVITSGEGVYISTSGDDKARSIWVCIPKYDYFEYLEVRGATIEPNRAGTGYDAMKQAFMRMAQKGFIHPLGHENLLQSETPK